MRTRAICAIDTHCLSDVLSNGTSESYDNVLEHRDPRALKIVESVSKLRCGPSDYGICTHSVPFQTTAAGLVLQLIEENVSLFRIGDQVGD